MGLSDCRVEASLAVADLGRARRFYERQAPVTPWDREHGGRAEPDRPFALNDAEPAGVFQAPPEAEEAEIV